MDLPFSQQCQPSPANVFGSSRWEQSTFWAVIVQLLWTGRNILERKGKGRMMKEDFSSNGADVGGGTPLQLWWNASSSTWHENLRTIYSEGMLMMGELLLSDYSSALAWVAPAMFALHRFMHCLCVGPVESWSYSLETWKHTLPLCVPLLSWLHLCPQYLDILLVFVSIKHSVYKNSRLIQMVNITWCLNCLQLS